MARDHGPSLPGHTCGPEGYYYEDCEGCMYEAEPTCTCDDEDTGRGFEDCPVHDPDPIVIRVGSATPQEDDNG
jgi:hypothetical protein